MQASLLLQLFKRDRAAYARFNGLKRVPSSVRVRVHLDTLYELRRSGLAQKDDERHYRLLGHPLVPSHNQAPGSFYFLPKFQDTGNVLFVAAPEELFPGGVSVQHVDCWLSRVGIRRGNKLYWFRLKSGATADFKEPARYVYYEFASVQDVPAIDLPSNEPVSYRYNIGRKRGRPTARGEN